MTQSAPQVGDTDYELLNKFIKLLTATREHGKERTKYGVGSKEEAYAFSLTQRAALDIERHLLG